MIRYVCPVSRKLLLTGVLSSDIFRSLNKIGYVGKREDGMEAPKAGL